MRHTWPGVLDRAADAYARLLSPTMTAAETGAPRSGKVRA